jgi:hypothetical protein
MTLPPEQRAAAAELLARRARTDPAVFNRLVYRDSRTGKPWETQPFQREWEAAIDAQDWPLDPDGKPIVRLVIFAPAGHGKTECLARSWLTRQIGANPNTKAAILCNEQSAAVDRLMAVRRDIESNPRLKAIFPALRQDPAGKWQDKELFFAGAINAKDPGLQAIGIGGAVIGARLDVGVVDDPCDFENTWTQAQREKALAWYLATFESRFDGRGRIVVIMTSWNDEDLGHLLVARHGYRMLRYEACDENFDNILWPGKFTAQLLRQIADTLGPIEFARTMRNLCMDDSFRRIKEEWVRKGLDRGRGIPAGVVPQGAVCTITALDPAGGKHKKKGDLSAFFTASLLLNGDRHLVEVDAGRMTSPDLKKTIARKHDAFRSLIGVEDNGVQDWLRQDVVEDTAIPIVGRSTTSDKWDPATGVESIGLELYNGKWIIPSVVDANGIVRPATAEIAEWIREMLAFQLGAHTGDRLMASYIWRCIAREEETRQRKRLGGIRVGVGITQSSPWRP